MQGFPLKVLISAGKGFILCTALIFASCDNFLEGAGLKRSLDDSIELANTPSVNIEISLQNSAQGTILPEGNVNTKISQTTEIEFRMSKDYEFKGFEVIDKSDFSVLEGSDCPVIFLGLTQTDNGYITIIKATIKVTGRHSALLIRPKCRSLNDKKAPEFTGDLVLAASREDFERQRYLDSGWIFESSSVSEIKNHISNTLYMSFYVHEEESSVAAVKVIETPVESRGGTAMSPNPRTFTATNLKAAENSGTWFCTAEYTLSTSVDGFIRLEIFAVDEGDNETEHKTVYVLKDTVCEAMAFLEKSIDLNHNTDHSAEEIENFYTINPDGSADADFTIGVTEDKYAKDRFTKGSGYTIRYATSKTSAGLDLEPLTEITQKTDLNETKKFIARNFDLVSCPIHIPDISTLTHIRLSITDEAGNENLFDFEIPGLPEEAYSYIGSAFNSYKTFYCKILTDKILADENTGIFYHKNSDSGYAQLNPHINPYQIMADTQNTSTDYYATQLFYYKDNWFDKDFNGTEKIYIQGPAVHFSTDRVPGSSSQYIPDEKYSCTITHDDENIYIQINIDEDYFRTLSDCRVSLNYLKEGAEKLDGPSCRMTLSRNSIGKSSYYLYIYAFDTDGNFIKGARQVIPQDSDLSMITSAETKPEIYYYSVSAQDSCGREFYCSGSLELIKMNAELFDFDKCAVIEYQAGNYHQVINSPLFKRYDNKQASCYIPLKQIPENESCRITITAEDAAGNSTDLTVNFSPYIKASHSGTIVYSSKGDLNGYCNILLLPYHDIEVYPSYAHDGEVFIIESDGSSWQSLEEVFETDDVSKEFRLLFNSKDEHKKGFARIEHLIRSDINISYVPEFYWVEGIKSASVTDINELRAGIQVYSDVPFLVHTIYSPVNWGEDVSEWEYHSISISDRTSFGKFSPATEEMKVFETELSPECITGDHSQIPYYYPFPRDIPEGMYYTAIVHYADGTALMSSIRQK